MKPEKTNANAYRLFARPQSWIEGNALQQLDHVTSRRGVTDVVGLPDLHQGKYGPVGCAILTADTVHPDLVGTDIGCGMSLYSLELPARKIKADKAADRMRKIGLPWEEEAIHIGNEHGFFTGHESKLGTVGGGNHFCELQVLHEIRDAQAASFYGLASRDSFLLVHSGSRSYGADIFTKHWDGTSHGLDLDGGGQDYIADHDRAVAFADINRNLIARRAAEALKSSHSQLLNVPHNFIELAADGILHRKGAATATRGLVPIPGSRGTFTYIVEPLHEIMSSLGTIAHGAGRKHDRRSMEAKAKTSKSTRDRLTRSAVGSRIICDDQKLSVEESPMAYKDIETVIADLEHFGLVKVVAITRPVVTFKSISEGRKR